MKLLDILHNLEQVAPVALSDDFCKKYSIYDNSGIIYDGGEEICGALFSLDLSTKSVEVAKARGFNLIVTHHPAIYGGISRIKYSDPIAKCIQSGISIISMHLNFDAAPEGIDYHLMRGLGGRNAEILASLDGGGYGRIYSVSPESFTEYFSKVKKGFLTDRAVSFGGEREVKKVASFCGAGCDDKAINFAISRGADVFVSSDMKHHEIAALLEHGINVIQLTHYSAESYGFNKIYNEISSGLKIKSAYLSDEDLI